MSIIFFFFIVGNYFNIYRLSHPYSDSLHTNSWIHIFSKSLLCLFIVSFLMSIIFILLSKYLASSLSDNMPYGFSVLIKGVSRWIPKICTSYERVLDAITFDSPKLISSIALEAIFFFLLFMIPISIIFSLLIMKSKIVIKWLNIKNANFYFTNILVINVNTQFRNILDNFKLHIYKSKYSIYKFNFYQLI